MGFKGIVLDFNGTLIWDTPLHKQAWMSFSQETGINLTEKQYYNNIHGKSNRNILEMLLDRKIDEEELVVFSRHKEELYRRSCLENPDIYTLAPGVSDFLEYIAEVDVPRTIATASEKDNVDFFIETLNLQKWFDTSLFVYDDGTMEIKPAPDLYVAAAERLDLSASELVIVEDTYFGALAAKKAGAGYLIITGPAEQQHEQLGSLGGVDLFISDFDGIDRNLFSL